MNNKRNKCVYNKHVTKNFKLLCLMKNQYISRLEEKYQILFIYVFL